MTSTRDHIISGNRNRSEHTSLRDVVHLRPGGGGDEITFDELPLAVGFGSPVVARPRRLNAVPGLPVEFVGLPRSRGAGRVIELPLVGSLDLAGPRVRDDPRVLRPELTAPDSSPPRSCRPEPVALRLTARGRAALIVVAAAVGLSVVVASWFGASAASSPARSARPAQVVVHEGDTLWSIAGRIAPDRDPRVIVDQLLRVNRLDTPALVPGQVLHTH